jgi:NADH-quinone oxidoreductase subunit L
MFSLLWLIPALPLAGFSLLVLLGGRLARPGVAMIGVGSVAVSAGLALLLGATFIMAPPPGHAYVQTLWQWMAVAGFTPAVAFHLDPLSLVMVVVITVVGFLIHLYAAEFMIGEEGYGRFFAYMNLFVASMLTLVLADDLLLLYLGWEGVGLCSYLLIGFWYADAANGRAAQKAFLVTRVGDTAMAVGLFLLVTSLGTLHIQELLQRAARQWPVGSGLATAAAALLLGGAVGKSAQLPLQTWLPDAMAGPTPVSALIHAATMVTAGVYLIARTHVLFTLAPAVQTAVAVIGALTLLLAGCSALVQRDLKRVLAYSTISQVGYMFLALGAGAWAAAVFHFMTHAFFKALLFLAAGAVIRSLRHEHDIFRMGGLRARLPVTYWTFLIAAASLAGVPLVTAGFYSKEWILWEVWSAGGGGPWLWAAGYLGALLTAVYSFRVFFVAFCGEAKTPVGERPGPAMQIPLVVLAVFSVASGFVQLPPTLGNVPLFSEALRPAFPQTPAAHADPGAEVTLQLLAAAASLLGVFLASRFFLYKPETAERLARTSWGEALHRLWFCGWGFDWLYDKMFVRPVVWAARANRDDFIDAAYAGVARLGLSAHRALRVTQTGQVRWYAAVTAAGSILVVALMLWV